MHLGIFGFEHGHGSLGLGVLKVHVSVVNCGNRVAFEDKQLVDTGPSEPFLAAAIGTASSGTLCHLARVYGRLLGAVVEGLEQKSFDVFVIGGSEDVAVVFHPPLHVEILRRVEKEEGEKVSIRARMEKSRYQKNNHNSMDSQLL